MGGCVPASQERERWSMQVIKGRTVFEFSSLENAKSFAIGCEKPMQIILGDAPFYWVASLADATWLTANGYELLDAVAEAR
jgi:hypothetical protein